MEGHEKHAKIKNKLTYNYFLYKIHLEFLINGCKYSFVNENQITET